MADPLPDLSAVLAALTDLPAKLAEAARLPALLPQEQVPGYVGLSRPAMFRLLAEGKFPKPVALAGAGRKYRRADLDKWIAGLKPAKT